MSTMYALNFRVALLLGVGLLLTAPVSAQAPGDRGKDYLDEVRRRTEIAAQKVESDVHAALVAAQREKDPAQALAHLKKALAALEDDTSLTPSRRDTLTRMLKDRIRVTQANASGPPASTSDSRLEHTARRDAEAERAAEQARIKQSMDLVRQLQREGKTAEANQLARQLAASYPDSPGIQAAVRSTATTDQLSSSRGLRAERERRVASIYRDVERSAMLPDGDYSFPDAKKWREMTERRKKLTAQITPKEQSILKALNAAIDVDFKGSRFQDVIEYLASYTGQPILLDKSALSEAGIDYETPISMTAKGISVRTVLRKVLGDYNLAYIIKDQAIQVTSPLKARESMTVRAYPVAEIVNGGLFGGTLGMRFGPAVQQAQMLQNAAQLIDMIQSTVERQSWQANGGNGTITFDAGTMALVVKQSAEVHSMLGGSFSR